MKIYATDSQFADKDRIKEKLLSLFGPALRRKINGFNFSVIPDDVDLGCFKFLSDDEIDEQDFNHVMSSLTKANAPNLNGQDIEVSQQRNGKFYITICMPLAKLSSWK